MMIQDCDFLISLIGAELTVSILMAAVAGDNTRTLTLTGTFVD